MTSFSSRLLNLVILSSALCNLASAAPAPQVIIQEDAPGRFTLMRDGKPFVIRGAGGTGHLKDLVKYGGNSIRTWGIDSLSEKIEGKPLLDHCQELGIAVTAGIWIGHVRHGFNYSDEAQLKKQRDMVRAAVRKYKDHPALLMWGLGNEMEGPESDGKDARIWKELNVLAGIVKEEDPGHPVMTVIAGAASSKVKGILANYPNIDVLGVNAYGGASGAVRAVKQAGWKKPFVLTEFGPQGHWEVAKTSWGVPIEPASRDKAASYYATMSLLAENSDICFGSYVFLWGQKQEVTSTWYGMFLASGEKLPTVDAACYAWSGKWPSNRSPKIARFDSPLKEATVAPGKIVDASIEVTDSESDTLKFEWSVREESTDRKSGGDKEAEPPSVAGSITSQDGPKVTVKIPAKPGSYRLFVIVRDGKGGASADNIPFRVAR
ncbi:MAG: glycoside hydrolase family 2 TIM barrel-domain containing protein [Verrucomicrobiota bacterium]